MNCTACATPIKKPDQYRCRSCGRVFCGKHVYSRVDGKEFVDKSEREGVNNGKDQDRVG